MSARDTAISVAREADPSLARGADVPAAGDAHLPPAQPADAASRDPALPPSDQGLKALGRSALAAAGEQEYPRPPISAGEASSATSDPASEAPEESPAFDIARVAWLATVLALLLAVTILVLNGYIGYAGVTLAVALAAAINLL
jgi:hypothetical protein